MSRDGATPYAAQRALAAQTTREARLAIADDVIDNSGDVAALAPQVEALHHRYLKLAQP
jgi:dephospho-CoA kinase